VGTSSRCALRHARGRVAPCRPGYAEFERADRRQRVARSALLGRAGESPLLREPKAGSGLREALRQKREDAPPRALLEGAGDDGLPVWLGAAVFDDGLGVSHYTGQVTHHTAPDIDAERDFLMSDLEHAKKVEEIYSVSGVGPTLFSRNGGGDAYFTDGDIAFARLVSGCEGEEGTPRTLLGPPRIEAKNAFFARLAALWRRLHSPSAAGAS
jgi:hypothetical protein